MEAEQSVGGRIKHFRLAKKMTIKELAAEAGITSSMLSQIEHDKANPSLNTIRLIAKTLSVPMFRLFMEDTGETSPVVRPEQRGIISKNAVEYELLTPDMNGGIEFCMLKLGQDGITVESPMSHAGEEVALVIKGAFELSLDDEKLVLSEGDSVRIRPHQIHNWVNIAKGESVLVFAISPPSF